MLTSNHKMRGWRRVHGNFYGEVLCHWFPLESRVRPGTWFRTPNVSNVCLCYSLGCVSMTVASEPKQYLQGFMIDLISWFSLQGLERRGIEWLHTLLCAELIAFCHLSALWTFSWSLIWQNLLFCLPGGFIVWLHCPCLAWSPSGVIVTIFRHPSPSALTPCSEITSCWHFVFHGLTL